MNALAPLSSTSTAVAGRHALEPQSLPEAMRFAEMLANSTMIPRDYQGKPANVLICLQWAREVGLGPMQALNGIAVINGRPSLWGDAALAVVQAHPHYGSHKEWVEGEGDNRAGYCTLTRKGHEPETRSFSVADAKKAGLWGKSGPWQQYPDRMLQLRARGFCIRDKFADALRGVITAEEAQDYQIEQRPQPPARGPQIDLTPTPEPWPMLDPSGTERPAKDSRQWVQWCRAAISKLENPEAVVTWRNAMEQHFDALQSRDAEAVEAVRNAAEERMETLAAAYEGSGE